MKRALIAATAVAALATAMPAAAQTGAPPEAAGEVGDIVVTAQRRSQRLEDVPLSVSVFGDDFITRGRSQTVADLVAYTPGVSGTTVSTTTPRITVRGVSTEDFGVGSDPALGIYVDDIYLGRGVSSIADLFDVERVEVIKGPQGTLFGRNTTAGAISIKTARPDATAFAANADASLGNFGLVTARGALNLPLGGDLALRIAGSTRNRDGFVANTLGGRIAAIESHAVRAGLGFDGGTLRALLSAEYRAGRSQPGPYLNRVLVGTDPFGPISSNLIDGTPERARDHIDAYRATLRIEAELGDAVTLTSITGYNGFDNSYLEDTDASPLTLLHFGTDGRQDSYSQELRLTGKSGAFAWSFGASFARDIIASYQYAAFSEEDFCTILFAGSCADALGVAGAARVREASLGRVRNTSGAIYGDVTLSATDRLELVGGLRWARDVKRFRLRLPLNDNLLGPVIIVPPSPDQLAALGSLGADGTLRQRFAASSWQPRAAIRYRLTEEISAYLSASRGFKAGGFNQLSPGPAFAPEKIWSYEAGVKGTAFDRRLRFDLSVYRFDYRDLQVLVDFAGSVVTRNAGAASGEGVELQLSARPVDGLTISGGLALQNAKYDRFIPNNTQDFSGNRLVRAPRFSSNLVVDGAFPLREGLAALARVEASYRSRQFFDPSNRLWESQKGYALVNASIGLGIGEGWEARTWIQNVFNKRYLVDTSQVVADVLEYAQRGEPRTYGIQIVAKFD
jgi:iron complex outermembrane recepter protein